MIARGDIESVNLSTGERGQCVSGNGESVLESLGIPGLEPVDPADLADYEKTFEGCWNQNRGGLRLPPASAPACSHDWQPFELHTSWTAHSASVFVSKCTKCHVLGMPPKEG